MRKWDLEIGEVASIGAQGKCIKRLAATVEKRQMCLLNRQKAGPFIAKNAIRSIDLQEGSNAKMMRQGRLRPFYF